MSIKQEADGTYTVSYHKRHPKTNAPVSRRKIKIKTKAEAQRVFNSLVMIVEDQLRKTIIPSWEKTLELHAEDQLIRGINKSTVYSMTTILKKHTFPIWQERLIDKIERVEIRNLVIDGLQLKTESHRQFILKCIRSVFNFAVESNLVATNPTPPLKISSKG